MTRLIMASEEELADTFTRQLGLCHPNDLLRLGRVLLIGAGGIGSWTGLALAKMGVAELEVYDADNVETHNQPNQLYGEGHVGLSKVDAMEGVVNLLAGTCIVHPHQEEVDEGALIRPGKARVVISGVDSMRSRSAIWQRVRSGDAEWYIDARMGAKVVQLYCVRLNSLEMVKAYERTLFDDSEGVEEPCTARSIVYTPMLTAALICDDVALIATGGVPPFDEAFDFVTRTYLVS